MAKSARTFRNRAIRNIGSAGISAANSSTSLIGKAAASTAKWATTDHTGISDALGRMPKMGFLDSLRYIFLITLAHIVCYVMAGILMFLLIAYGIPFLIRGGF